MLTRCCLASLFVLLATLSALAADETQPADGAWLDAASTGPCDMTPASFQIFWENDGTFAKPNNATDRHYTDGLAVGVSAKPEWARCVADWLPFHREFAQESAAHG